jgi:hypothetical protein
MDLDLPQSLLKKGMRGSTRAVSPNEFILGNLNERQVALLNEIFLEKDFFLSQKDWTTGALRFRLTNIAFKANQVFKSLIKSYIKTLMASEGCSELRWKKYVVERALQIKIQLKGSSASSIFSEEGFSDEVDLDASIKLYDCPRSTCDGRYVNREKLLQFFGKVAENAISNLLKKRFKGRDLPFWDLFREKFILFSDNSTFLISFCGIDFSFSFPIFTGYKRGSTFLHESLSIYLPFREGKFCINGDLEIPLSTEFSTSSEKVAEAFDEKIIVIPEAETLTHNGFERLSYSISKGWSVDPDSAAGVEILIKDFKERKFSRMSGDFLKDDLFKLMCNKAKSPEDALAIYLNAVSLCSKEPELLKDLDNYLKIPEIFTRFPGKVQLYFLGKSAFDLIWFLSMRASLCLSCFKDGFDPIPSLSKERAHGSNSIRFVNIGQGSKSFVTLLNLDYENLIRLFYHFQANYPTNEILSEIYEFSSVFEIQIDSAIQLFYFHRLMHTMELSDSEKKDLNKIVNSWLEIIALNEKLLKLDFIQESLFIFISEKSKFCFPERHKSITLELLNIKSNPRFIPLFLESIYGEGRYYELLKETLEDPHVAAQSIDFLLKLTDDFFVSKCVAILDDILAKYPVFKEEKILEIINFLKNTNALASITSCEWIYFFEKNLETNFSLLEPLFEASSHIIFLNPSLFSHMSKNEKLVSILLPFLEKKIEGFELGPLLRKTVDSESFTSFFKDLLISKEPVKVNFAFKLFLLDGAFKSLISQRGEILKLLLELKSKDLFPIQLTKELISFFSSPPREEAGLKFCLFGLNLLELSNKEDEEFFISFMNQHFEKFLTLDLNAKQKENLLNLFRKCYQIELRKGEVFSKSLSWKFNNSVDRLLLEDLVQLPISEQNKNILSEQAKAIISDYPYLLTPIQFENLLALSHKNEELTKKLSDHLVKIYHDEFLYQSIFQKIKAVESIDFLKSYLRLSPNCTLLQSAISNWRKTKSNLPRTADILEILEALKGKAACLEKLMFLDFVIEQIDPRDEKILDLLILIWLEITSLDKLKFLKFFSVKSSYLKFNQKISMLLTPLTPDTHENLMICAQENPAALHLVVVFLESFKTIEKKTDSTLFLQHLHNLANALVSISSDVQVEDKQEMFWHFLTSYIAYFLDLEFDPKMLSALYYVLSTPHLSMPYAEKIFQFIESKLKHIDFKLALCYLNQMNILTQEKRFFPKTSLNKSVIDYGIAYLEKDIACYEEFIAFIRARLPNKKGGDKDYLRVYLSLLNLLKINGMTDFILDLLIDDPFILRNGSYYLDKHKNKLLDIFRYLFEDEDGKINLEGKTITKEFKSWILECALVTDDEELFKDLWFIFIHPTYDFSDDSHKIYFTEDLKKVFVKNKDFFHELLLVYEFRCLEDFKTSSFISHLISSISASIPNPKDNLDLYYPIYSVQLGHYASLGLSIDDFCLRINNVIQEFYFFSVKISKTQPLSIELLKKFALSLIYETKSLKNPNDLCYFYKRLFYILQSLNFRHFSEMLGYALLQQQSVLEKILDSENVDDWINVVTCFYSINSMFKEKHVTGAPLKVFFKALLDRKMQEVFDHEFNLNAALRMMGFFIINKIVFSEKNALADRCLILEGVRFITNILRTDIREKSIEEMNLEKIQTLLMNLTSCFDDDWLAFLGFHVEFLQLIDVIHLLTKTCPLDEKPRIILINWQIKSLGIMMANCKLGSLIYKLKVDAYNPIAKESLASAIKSDIEPSDFEAIKLLTSLNETMLKLQPLVIEKPHFDFVKNYLRLLLANSLKEFKFTFLHPSDLAELGKSLLEMDSYIYEDLGRIKIENDSLVIEKGEGHRKLVVGPGKTKMGSDLAESYADLTFIMTSFLESYDFEEDIFCEFIKKLIAVSKFVIRSESPDKCTTKYLSLCVAFLKSKNIALFPLKNDDFFSFFNYLVSHLVVKDISTAESRELIEITYHLHLNFLHRIHFTVDEIDDKDYINQILAIWVNQSCTFFQMLRHSEQEAYVKTTFDFFARLIMMHRGDIEIFPIKPSMVLSYLFIFALNIQKIETFINFIQFNPWLGFFFIDDDNQLFAAAFLQSLINSQQPIKVFLDRLVTYYNIAKNRSNAESSKKLSQFNTILQRLVSHGISGLTEIPLTKDKFAMMFFEKILLDFLLIISACKARSSRERIELGKSVASIEVSLVEIHDLIIRLKEPITSNQKYVEKFQKITEEHLEVFKKDKTARELKNTLRGIIEDLKTMKA